MLMKEEKDLCPSEDMDTTEREDTADVAEAPEDLVLKLSKPYTFEGQKYTEVDLSALEDTKTIVLENVGKIMAKLSPGTNPATIEMTLGFAQLLAAKVTGKPVEFFRGLPAKDGIGLKSTVVGFLYGGDGDN